MGDLFFKPCFIVNKWEESVEYWNVSFKDFFKNYAYLLKNKIQTLGNTAVKDLIEVMIFNSWAVVYGTDGTLSITETIIGGFCFPPFHWFQKSGIPFYQSKNFSISNYSLYQINNFSIAYFVLHSDLGVGPCFFSLW